MSVTTDVAIDKFMSGFNCAQAVLFAFCDQVQLDSNLALKLACGFGAGMGRKGEVCGAVSGGVLAISARYGRDEAADASATEVTYKKTSELLRRFAAKHNTVICKVLLGGCDLTIPEGQQWFKDKELKKVVCTKCVESVVEIVEELLV